MITFPEMPYERPDPEALKEKLRELTSRLQAANTYEKARAVFLEKDRLDRHVDTLGTLASVRHSIDTRDEFYDEENKFWNKTWPELQEYDQTWTAAMLASPFRADFAAEYGDLMFIKAEMELKTFSPNIIPELQQENDLRNEYQKLIASAQIPFEGGIYTISQMSPFKTDADDERRLAAWKAEGQWYKDHQDKLDEIYDKLTKLRDSMGRKMGYEGFTQLGYYRMGRNCYTKEDVEKFRAAVRTYLVPVAESIYRAHAKRLGKEYPMSYADNALEFRSGNPRPQGTADDILAAGKKFYDELSTETSEFFRMMLEGKLMDVLSTEGKEGGGYCTGIMDYGVPFIFANFNGTAWPWAENFFGPDTRKFLYSHLAGALTFIPYGTMVDHFQHLVYEHPGWSPRERHNAWKELSAIYTPWARLDGDIPFFGDGEAWQRQSHIYASPFYYIDYCLAQTVSLEIWAMLQESREKAWEHYMAYTKQGGSRTFTELLANAGLVSPFDEECLKTVCSTAKKWLENYDMTGIE